MSTEIKVWQVRDDKLVEITQTNLADDHYEEDLEKWIEADTSILGSKLLVISRQQELPNAGILDLLCIDESGQLVIVEFKRNATSRDTVAQILDYASWIDGATADQIEEYAFKYCGKDLSDAFSEAFEKELDSLTPQNHRMIVVAPNLDASAERIINYLAERHSVDINAAFFRYARTQSGDKVLVRTVLVPEDRRTNNSYQIPLSSLMETAKKLHISKLVDICRQLSNELHESSATRTYGGSIRYWSGGKMILGVNIAGERAGQKRKPPAGQLDIWIPIHSLSDLSEIPQEKLRSTLSGKFTAFTAGANDLVVRLKSEDDAKSLVTIMRKWLRSTPTDAEAKSTVTAA